MRASTAPCPQGPSPSYPFAILGGWVREVMDSAVYAGT